VTVEKKQNKFRVICFQFSGNIALDLSEECPFCGKLLLETLAKDFVILPRILLINDEKEKKVYFLLPRPNNQSGASCYSEENLDAQELYMCSRCPPRNSCEICRESEY